MGALYQVVWQRWQSYSSIMNWYCLIFLMSKNVIVIIVLFGWVWLVLFYFVFLLPGILPLSWLFQFLLLFIIPILNWLFLYLFFFLLWLLIKFEFFLPDFHNFIEHFFEVFLFLCQYIILSWFFYVLIANCQQFIIFLHFLLLLELLHIIIRIWVLWN